MKKLMTAIAISTMVLSTSTVLASTDKVDVIALDQKVDFSRIQNGVSMGEPFIDNNRTFLPIRAISEDLGYEVDWDQENQTAVISKDENVVKIRIGDTQALVNGVKTNIDVQAGLPLNTKALLKGQRTYVPVRFISEAMGDMVEYRQPSSSNVKNRTVYINSTDLPVEGEVKPDIPTPPVVKPDVPTPPVVKPDVPTPPVVKPDVPTPPAGAELITDSPQFKEKIYKYIVKLPNGGKIEDVIVSTAYDNPASIISGIDNNGDIFNAILDEDGFEFRFREPAFTKEDIALVRLHASKFIN